MIRYGGLRATTLEAINDGNTRSRGPGTHASGALRGNRERTDRVFRDIHWAEFMHPIIVLVDSHGGLDATGHDDLPRRHWSVVCSDRRGARPR